MMQKDSKDHNYLEVGNLRVTYVPAEDRESNNDWSGFDVIRIQSYKNAKNKSLHRGAELPIESSERFIELISALCTIYNSERDKD